MLELDIIEDAKILAEKSEPLSFEESLEIGKTLKTYVENNLNSLGLAAIQINKRARVFAYVSNTDNENRVVDIVINPEIIKKTKTSQNIEGCLSISHCRAVVERAKTIKVKYIDENGNQTKRTLQGTPAIAFQHEYDHLDGYTILTTEGHKELLPK